MADARYDLFADWYEDWSRDGQTLIGGHAELPVALTGVRVLDVACGLGGLTRDLAARGAVVVGLDISEAMLGKARLLGGDRVTYVHGDVGRPDGWWDGQPFDGCTCELALMDIDDLPRAFASVAGVVRPGGWFVASVVHPCFPGNAAGLSSWPPGAGYDAEGWWSSPDHNPDGARIRVGSSHRKLSTYLNALVAAGFELESVVEPPAPVPTYLLWRGRRR